MTFDPTKKLPVPLELLRREEWETCLDTWFAWYPVKTVAPSIGWVWFRMVCRERRIVYGHNIKAWQRRILTARFRLEVSARAFGCPHDRAPHTQTLYHQIVWPSRRHLRQMCETISDEQFRKYLSRWEKHPVAMRVIFGS